jgi:hypothetical protein
MPAFPICSFPFNKMLFPSLSSNKRKKDKSGMKASRYQDSLLNSFKEEKKKKKQCSNT